MELLIFSTENLPPTQDAAKYHSLRTFHQVQTWMGRDLNPEDWGFKMVKGSWTPIRMSNTPGSGDLLKIIRCNCTQDCATKSCSCRKLCIFCSIACGNCKGVACRNKETLAFVTKCPHFECPLIYSQ